MNELMVMVGREAMPLSQVAEIARIAIEEWWPDRLGQDEGELALMRACAAARPEWVDGWEEEDEQEC